MRKGEQAAAAANRPGLQVGDGVLHRLLVVLPHVLVHVRVVGADVLLRAAVGHGAELQRRVLLLGMLELAKQREVRGGGGGQETPRPDLMLSTSQTHLQPNAQIKSAGRSV